MPAKAAASCAATEATNAKKSSGRLLLRSAAITVRLRAARLGLGLLEAARYADAPLPDDLPLRCCCAWFRRIPVLSLKHSLRAA